MESRVSLLKEAFSKWLIDFAGRHEEISEASPLRANTSPSAQECASKKGTKFVTVSKLLAKC